jgi:hypothetical protein
MRWRALYLYSPLGLAPIGTRGLRHRECGEREKRGLSERASERKTEREREKREERREKREERREKREERELY